METVIDGVTYVAVEERCASSCVGCVCMPNEDSDVDDDLCFSLDGEVSLCYDNKTIWLKKDEVRQQVEVNKAFGHQMPLFPEIEPPVTVEEDEAFTELSKAQKDYIKAIGTDDTYTGGSVDYYSVEIKNPTDGGPPYVAQCNDIIEALGMSFGQGNILKAVWRMCAAENLNKAKRGYTDGLYDAEKIVFYGEREITKRKKT